MSLLYRLNLIIELFFYEWTQQPSVLQILKIGSQEIVYCYGIHIEHIPSGNIHLYQRQYYPCELLPNSYTGVHEGKCLTAQLYGGYIDISVNVMPHQHHDYDPSTRTSGSFFFYFIFIGNV